ncbi:MAG: C2H2-type zinc finger protein [Planctomycetes bacterium]|nr:C2H2-type zinc finger protein [Planctomycetota bacterium]
MAKRRRFKCTKCGRKFSMAAHLARHMNTTHASKKVKATKRVSVATRAKRGAGSDLGGVLGSLKAYHDRLTVQRNEIDSQMQAIDAAMATLGAGAARPVIVRRSRGKGPRAGSLKEYIARVLRGLVRGKSVKDIAAAVKKAGYKSKSKRWGHTVSKVLADMKDVTRVGRGVYRLK